MQYNTKIGNRDFLTTPSTPLKIICQLHCASTYEDGIKIKTTVEASSLMWPLVGQRSTKNSIQMTTRSLFPAHKALLDCYFRTNVNRTNVFWTNVFLTNMFMEQMLIEQMSIEQFCFTWSTTALYNLNPESRMIISLKSSAKSETEKQNKKQLVCKMLFSKSLLQPKNQTD